MRQPTSRTIALAAVTMGLALVATTSLACGRPQRSHAHASSSSQGATTPSRTNGPPSPSAARFAGVPGSTGLERTVVPDPGGEGGVAALARGGDLGFTTFRPSADSRIVYVSSSRGDDARDGLSERRAVRTVAVGLAKLRDGHPDWILFRRGDRFPAGLGRLQKSGRSHDEPMVYSTYGSGPRPTFETGADSALTVTGAGGTPEVVGHLAIVSLRFRATGRDLERTHGAYVDGEAGIYWLRGAEDVLVEDSVFELYPVGIVFHTFDGKPQRDVRLRRNLVLDSYGRSHSQGAYLDGVDGLLLEGNLFVNRGIDRRQRGVEPSVFSHNVYVNTACRNVVARENILIGATSHGLQLRPGGIAEDNLLLRNAIGLLLGGGDEPVPGGVSGAARHNVILEGTDISAELPRGWGIDLANVRDLVVDGNVVAYARTPDASVGIRGGVAGARYGDNVVFAWGDVPSTEGPFVDETRTVGRYHRDHGGEDASFEGFVRELRRQSRARYRPEYGAKPITLYIREGFARR